MATASEKAYRGIGMEGAIARWYEQTTRKDVDSYRSLAARLAARLPEGGDVLEVAPGPGFLAIELAKRPGLRVTGLDISKTFIALAAYNAADAGVRVEFRQGNASAMPFAGSSFDLLVCRAAFKNFAEPVRALQEMYRVLRPGGRGVIVDLRRDAPMSAIRQYVHGLRSGRWERWWMATTLSFLRRRAYTREEFARMLAQVPFRHADVRAEAMGFEIWLTK